MKHIIKIKDKTIEVTLDPTTKRVRFDGKLFGYEALRDFSGEITAVLLNGKRIPVSTITDEDRLDQRGTKNEIHAPLHGQITKIFTPNGAEATKGQVILALEAMKMENEILSPLSGILRLNIKEKALVKAGQLLFSIEPS